MQNNTVNWPNMLLVSGTGRDVGKTTFACKLIGSISKNQNTAAIKITPHMHGQCNSCTIVYKNKNIIVTEEKSTTYDKDSSKMLAAGAQKVYYIQTDDSNIEKAIAIIKPMIPNNWAVICESGALRSFIKPGIFVLMSIKNSKNTEKNIDKIPLADFRFWDYNYKIEDFKFDNGAWVV